MKIKIYIYKLTDYSGNISCDCIMYPIDRIYLYGYDSDKNCREYHHQPAHLAYVWAETYGFKLDILTKEIDV